MRLQMDYLVDDMEVVRGLWSTPPSPRALAALAAASSRRLNRIRSMPRPDAFIVYREATYAGPPVLERLAAHRAPMIFDLDDAIWIQPGDRPALSLRSVIRMPWKTRSIMRMSSGISAGNDYLAEFSRTLCDTVEVVPSTIDVTRTYTSLKHHTDDRPLTIGWSGSHSTVQFLRNILPDLAEIARTIPFRLLVVGATVEFPGLDIDCRPWTAATEVQTITEMDIGLMPLTVDEWTEGKCGMKALQYMGAGVPAVVTPIGVNTHIVEHGINGFHARSAAEWREAIEALTSAETRNAFGARARQKVVAEYSSEIAAGKLANLVRRVLN